MFTVVDFVVLNIAFLVTTLINSTEPVLHTRLVWLLVNVAYLPAAKWVTVVHRERSLQMDRVIRTTLLAVATHLICFLALLYFLDQPTVRWTSLAELYSLFGVSLVAWRVIGRFILKTYRRRGGNRRSVAIIGTGNTAMRLYEELMADPGFGFEVTGFFDLYCHPDFPFKSLYRGKVEDLPEFLHTDNIDEVYYTISGEDRDSLQTAINACDAGMKKFFYVPQISPYLTRDFKYMSLGAVAILVVRNNPLEQSINSFMKRAFDILFSSAFLLVSPLIFIPVALLIKLTSPGPVFFKQKRTGYKGEEFWCYKFRTMHVNNQSDTLQASKDDPRKTRFGDFLRRTSIDELPQFYNVLRGDMSVVGPRPHMLKHTADYSALIRNYMVRHLIKPGITGWAQVRGYRGQTEELWQMQKRVEHDIWYIEHWSFLLDIKIIGRTILNAFSKEENAF